MRRRLAERRLPRVVFDYIDGGAGIAIRTQLPANMPPLDVDPILVEQLLLNLLKNAVEAIEARQKISDADYRGRIGVTIGGDSEDVVVAVSDNGIGLPQDRERIISPM